MTTLRIALLWAFSWSMLLMSLALIFCAYLPRDIHIAMCGRLQGFVVLVARSVRTVFGG